MAERTLHFNSLPVPMRERLTRIFSRLDACEPYAVRPMEPAGVMIAWLIATAVVIWWLFFRAKPIGLPQWSDILWMTLAAFAGCGAILGYWRRRRIRAALPFPPGHYLFAMEVIDATGDVLRVHPMGDSTGVEATHQLVDGRYSYTDLKVMFPGRDFHFPISGREKAEGTLVRFNQDRAFLQQAAARQDLSTILRLDPLFEIRQGNLWSQATPATQEDLPRGNGLLWKSAAAACVAGPLLAAANSLLFDEVQFRKTRNRNYPVEYREYLKDGWLHRQEVQDELLPQRLFENAKTGASVRGLRNYLREFPNHRSAPAARTEIHQLYASALAQLRGHASPDAANFLRALLAWLEEHESPTVKVSFARPSADALAAVDRELAAKGGAVQGIAVAPISPSFTTRMCEAREAGIVQTLNAGFHEVVPQHILNLALGPRLAHPDEVDDVPILAIGYTIYIVMRQ